MERQYEVISYSSMNFKFTLGTLYYCIPHIHQEYELGLILKGEQRMLSHGIPYTLPAGDMWLLNSCQNHELSCGHPEEPYTFVELQIRPAFFKHYYPDLLHTEFNQIHLNEASLDPNGWQALRRLFVEAAYCYFTQPERYPLKCAAMINSLFDCLLGTVHYRVLGEQEVLKASVRNARIQRLAAYIDAHYDQKLLLSDLAEQEKLTLTYLSHLFTEEFGMTFQSYLMHLRCQRAQEMLLTTDMTLTDISMTCGFSAPRYFDKGFREVYGMPPRVYRAQFKGGLQAQALVDKHHLTRVATGTIFYTAGDSAALMDRLGARDML